MVVQNIAEAGAAEGLDPELAYELVLESFAGTIELLRRYDPIEVRASVASRGGATEAGLEALADAGVGDGVQAAVRASLERMRELSVARAHPGRHRRLRRRAVVVYFVLIIANVVLSWVSSSARSRTTCTLRAVLGFIEDTTNPYLNLFRSFVPRIGPLDISPIVAILVLSIVGGRWSSS